MKKIFLILILLSFGIISQAQLLAPKGIKIGKVKTGTGVITVDSITQYSTNQFKLWKGATLLNAVNDLKINKADSTGNAAGNYVTRKALTTALNDTVALSSVAIMKADSGKTSAGNYVTSKQMITAIASGFENVGFTLSFDPTPLSAPADATTYYIGSFNTNGISINPANIIIPFNCTLVGYSLVTRSTVACTNETGTLYVRINNTTDVELSSVITWGVGGAYVSNFFSGSSLNTNITAGDLITVKIITPTWATNATNIYMHTVLYFKNR